MFCALTQDKPRAETVLRHGVLLLSSNIRLHFID